MGRKRQRVPIYEAESLYAKGFGDEGGEGFRISSLRNFNYSAVVNKNLTKTQKSYIMLYYSENKTIAEIAEIYGVNKSTVSRTINRAKANLSRIFNCIAS